MPNPQITFWPENTLPAPDEVTRGDFLLTRNRATWHSRDGIVDGLIRTGERMELWRAHVPKGQRNELARWSHAVAVSRDTLIEATGKGVIRSPLDKYRDGDFLYVHTDLTASQRDDAVGTWERLVGTSYGYLTDVCIGFTALTGGALRVKLAHTVICSGLVAAGLGVYQWRDDPSFVRPDMLAAYHGIDGTIPYG